MPTPLLAILTLIAFVIGLFVICAFILSGRLSRINEDNKSDAERACGEGL